MGAGCDVEMFAEKPTQMGRANASGLSHILCQPVTFGIGGN